MEKEQTRGFRILPASRPPGRPRHAYLVDNLRAHPRPTCTGAVGGQGTQA